MKYNISKELFKDVFGNRYTFIGGYEDNFIIVIDEETGEDLYDLEFDTLMFKCIDYIKQNKYYLNIDIDSEINVFMLYSLDKEKKIFKSENWQGLIDCCDFIMSKK